MRRPSSDPPLLLLPAQHAGSAFVAHRRWDEIRVQCSGKKIGSHRHIAFEVSSRILSLHKLSALTVDAPLQLAKSRRAVHRWHSSQNGAEGVRVGGVVSRRHQALKSISEPSIRDRNP